MTSDLFQSIDEQDAATFQRVVDRLEARGQNPTFCQMRDDYFSKLPLGSAKAVLDMGCGTGVVTRALKAHTTAKVVGSDLSHDLIQVAKKLAVEKNVTVEFQVQDSHDFSAEEDKYDIVIAHTLVSHVLDPTTVLSQASKVTKPGGIIAIFDGDYSSISIGCGDVSQNARMVEGILKTMTANPFVMKQFPAIARGLELELVDFLPHLLAEAGTAHFFESFLNSYVPSSIKAGNLPTDEAGTWHKEQLAASDRKEFFGSCNYYTYILRKPEK